MKREHLIVLIVCLIVAMLIGFQIYRSYRLNSYTIEETTNDHQQWIQEKFDTHVTELVEKGDNIWIQADYFLDIGPDGIYLREGDHFYGIADEHTSSKFTLRRIGVETIVIDYESKTDFTSIGKNVIQIDRGKIELPLK